MAMYGDAHQCTAMHSNARQRPAMHSNVRQRPAMHSNVRQRPAMHSNAQQCTAMLNIHPNLRRHLLLRFYDILTTCAEIKFDLTQSQGNI